MINIIQSEYVKYKRTFTRKLIIFAPLFTIMIALISPWQFFVNQVYNLWPAIFIPILIALFSSLVAIQEKKAGNYRNLLVHNISPARIWIGKIIVMCIHTLLATLFLIILTIIIFPIVSKENIPLIKIFTAGSIIWLTSLTIVPIQLWAATCKGIFASMSLGFLGLIIGVIVATKSYWVYVPWSYPTRLMCPLMGVGPNALPLKIGDPLLDNSVIPVGIIMSIISLLIFTCITALWFNKREVR
ncbi:lantibiotic immunity ABC transporter MutE/EpiE family permease subunit [Clostridium arbusti]|uniref:lantibiotic immunity ABC transporter MutE/EpiE family permease subunit n=1 Tax=Clostridium arbusti TaxID=1137848 RepID=UPI000287CE24|nr:lantibiotic immunity ABC transporter MutE/EpiE family permease subunit [Clostridium arbusti]